ncbi:HelD family protein [Paenibacillus tyrfis]|uniref:Helicase n=1 Tax=Paenibacillus tyrfis TaxID=1501230 RepID=A0A081NWG6_9BACL|nr:UvrD-helicase domain-containing protein [Paenibacillus tyrfis]KEQ22789.1 helicase [Paenibacillus tyrfis]
MFNGTEAEERRYLEVIVAKLHQALKEMDDKISSTYEAVIESKKYLWDNAAALDPAERAANRVDVSLTIDLGEKAIVKRKRVQKLLQSPYFGRVDFKEGQQTKPDSFYIGVHSFTEENGHDNLIYDWRSPVASMFYDFEVGQAFYAAPVGEVHGEIGLKRQYKINQGTMEYMIESSMTIHDDVLQKELSGPSNERMKNIVATIQKEQNAIIRNEAAHELIIQGVAGSGKTSVALHRVAFLLYRYKETLSSRNVLIISPNKVFSDYISNVLPELGEEKIMEVSLEELAAKELVSIGKFQTFYEQVSELLGGTDDETDESVIERIKFKATGEFVSQMDAFIQYADEHYFSPEEIAIDKVTISKEALFSSYQASGRLPVKSRLEKTAAHVMANCKDEDGNRAPASASKKIKTVVKKMFKCQDVLSLYKDFYQHLGTPDMFKLKQGKKLEYSDVFPLIYLKIYFEGAAPFDFVKHLLVDEMQDYTPIQYAVLSKLFKCKKTILGDSSQSVNPYSSSSLTEIKKVFPEADTVELLKSYRSTVEITTFAQRLKPNSKLIPIERHGEEPLILPCHSSGDEMNTIRRLTGDFLASEHHSLGIICKTHAQAEEVYAKLKDMRHKIHLLDFNSEQFHEGIVVTYAHLAKGLEFDQVIVPFADASTYRTELDKSLLYIACSRAMHTLMVTCAGEITPFLKS